MSEREARLARIGAVYPEAAAEARRAGGRATFDGIAYRCVDCNHGFMEYYQFEAHLAGSLCGTVEGTEADRDAAERLMAWTVYGMPDAAWAAYGKPVDLTTCDDCGWFPPRHNPAVEH